MNEKASDSNQGGSVYHLDSSDPLGELIDRSQVSPEDIAEINRIMAAMAALRQAEEKLSEASLRYMKLNRTDMRALHFLIVAENRKQIVTPSAIAEHLGISTASTTKLLDRLERGDHILRHTHPTDRRALHITVQGFSFGRKSQGFSPLPLQATPCEPTARRFAGAEFTGE